MTLVSWDESLQCMVNPRFLIRRSKITHKRRVLEYDARGHSSGRIDLREVEAGSIQIYHTSRYSIETRRIPRDQ